MKKIIIMFLLVAILISSGCINQEEDNPNTNLDIINTTTGKNISYSENVEKIEIFHFHGNNQCQGCINIGKCAEDSVNEYFQYEQKEGLIVFDHINAELPENAELAEKYGVTGSSIWFGVYNNDGSFSKEQNINVWYKTNDMEKCREYMKEVIEEKLKG